MRKHRGPKGLASFNYIKHRAVPEPFQSFLCQSEKVLNSGTVNDLHDVLHDFIVLLHKCTH